MMLSNCNCMLRQVATRLRYELRYQRIHRFMCPTATTTTAAAYYTHHLNQAPGPASSMGDTASTSTSDGATTTSTTAATAVPPLSDITLAEFSVDSSTAMWDEQMALASQPGVCNLGLGFPDYAGSSLAREAAAAAMVEPSM
ncbi:unnamed protein product, partial [Laminaria digitata]